MGWCMGKHWKYLKYVIRHKWFVFLECLVLFAMTKRIAVLWRGITHDLSKFRPDEWFPYVEYFYGKGGNDEAFNGAWLRHQKRNPHHWQWWILQEDDGNTVTMEMSETSTLEMIADWVGAGMAIHGKRDIKEWYAKNKDTIVLHETTRKLVEAVFVQ